MGFWFWFWVCFGIIVLGLVSHVLIMVWVALKARAMAAPAAKLQKIGEGLAKTASQKPEIQKLVPALDQPIEQVFGRRKRILKAKRNRREERERRLVARLKNISYEESRLK